MTPTRTLLAFLILAAAFVFAFPETAINPGNLSKGHTQLAQKCWSCHKPFRGANSNKCAACHKIGDIGRVTTAGNSLPVLGSKRKVLFHVGLANKDCAACHTAHRSGRYISTGPRFEHDLLLVSIKSDCVSCHLTQKPHDSLHQSADRQCGTCHGTRGWRPATFDHTAYFRFDSNHPSRCDTCHMDSTSYASYTCYGCHAHTPTGMAAAHVEESIRNLEQCAKCHRTGNAEESEGRGRH